MNCATLADDMLLNFACMDQWVLRNTCIKHSHAEIKYKNINHIYCKFWICCTHVSRSNLSSALESNIQEDLNPKFYCIKEVFKTQTIEIGSQIHHQEILPCSIQGMKPQVFIKFNYLRSRVKTNSLPLPCKFCDREVKIKPNFCTYICKLGKKRSCFLLPARKNRVCRQGNYFFSS